MADQEESDGGSRCQLEEIPGFQWNDFLRAVIWGHPPCMAVTGFNNRQLNPVADGLLLSHGCQSSFVFSLTGSHVESEEDSALGHGSRNEMSSITKTARKEKEIQDLAVFVTDISFLGNSPIMAGDARETEGRLPSHQ